MLDFRRHPRLSRTLWAMLVFLAGSALLIAVVSYFFLIPAMRVANEATISQKRQLVAYSRLLLALVLFILCIGLLLLFRIGRFFFPRHNPRREPTKYVDAWAESGRRALPTNDEETE